MPKTPLFFRKAVAAARWRTKRFRQLRDNAKAFGSMDEDENHCKPTGPKMVKYGKLFLTTFPETALKGKKRTSFIVSAVPAQYESPVSIALIATNKKGLPENLLKHFVVAEVRLSFEKKAVIIFPQGRKGTQPQLDRFHQSTGLPWANFLIKQIEEHARKTGFRQVKIRTPESLHYYQTPSVAGRYATLEEAEKIRKRMENLFQKVADAMNYKREGEYFIKDL